MIEPLIKERLQRIFRLHKVSFNEPSDSREQECMFVEIETNKTNFKEKYICSRVTAKCTVFAQADKMPSGYLSRMINMADPADTKPFFFYEIESGSGIYQNIVQRTFSFLFIFSGQYDPEVGTISSIETTVNFPEAEHFHLVAEQGGRLLTETGDFLSYG